MKIIMREGDRIEIGISETESIFITLSDRDNGGIKEKQIDINVDSDSFEIDTDVDSTEQNVQIFI